MASDDRQSRMSSRQDFVTFEDSLRRLNALELKLTETVKIDIQTLRKTWTLPKVERVSRSAFKLFEIREQLKHARSIFMEEEVILQEFNEVQTLLKDLPMDEDDYEDTKENCFFLGVKLKDVRNKQGNCYSEIKDLEIKILNEIAAFKIEQQDMKMLDIHEVRATTPTHHIMEEIRNHRASKSRSRDPSPFMMGPLSGLKHVEHIPTDFNLEDLKNDEYLNDDIIDRCTTPMSECSLYSDSRPASRNSMLGDVVSSGVPLEDLDNFRQEMDQKIAAQPSPEETPIVQPKQPSSIFGSTTNDMTTTKPEPVASKEQVSTEVTSATDGVTPAKTSKLTFASLDDEDDDDEDFMADLLKIGGGKKAAEVKPKPEEKIDSAKDSNSTSISKEPVKEAEDIKDKVKEAAPKEASKDAKTENSLQKKTAEEKVADKKESLKPETTKLEIETDKKKVLKKDKSASATSKDKNQNLQEEKVLSSNLDTNTDNTQTDNTHKEKSVTWTEDNILTADDTKITANNINVAVDKMAEIFSNKTKSSTVEKKDKTKKLNKKARNKTIKEPIKEAPANEELPGLDNQQIILQQNKAIGVDATDNILPSQPEGQPVGQPEGQSAGQPEGQSGGQPEGQPGGQQGGVQPGGQPGGQTVGQPGGQLSPPPVAESKMSGANKSKMSSKLSSMDSELPPMETVHFQGDFEPQVQDDFSSFNTQPQYKEDNFINDDFYGEDTGTNGFNNQQQDRVGYCYEDLPEDFYERDEPISYRDGYSKPMQDDFNAQDIEGYDYGMDDMKTGSGFADGEFIENEPIYSTVSKQKTSNSSRYEKDGYESETNWGSEDAPRHGIIRRPDSQTSKNVTFDAPPQITGFTGDVNGEGQRPNSEQKGFLTAMTNGILSGNTNQILQSGMESLKYIVKKSNQGIKSALDKVDFKSGIMSPQDQVQMFDELFGHVGSTGFAQPDKPVAISLSHPRTSDIPIFQEHQNTQHISESALLMTQNEGFIKTLEKKMSYDYSSPDQIQLSPGPQRDLFTGEQIGGFTEPILQIEPVQHIQEHFYTEKTNRNDFKAFQEPAPISDVALNFPPVLRLDNIAAMEDYSIPARPPHGPVAPVKESVAKYIMDASPTQNKPSRAVVRSDNMISATGANQINVRDASSHIQDLVELRRRELKEKKAWIQNGMMGAMGFCVMLYLQSVETYAGYM